MLNITLRQLRYVDALARRGHFGRAAEECAISQPALSMQVREVEDMLGTALFERATRHVRPTAFGEAFVARARVILREVEELGALARTAQDGAASHLRLGIIPTAAPYILPTMMTALKDARPALDVSVRETITPRLIDDLTDGRLDAAIVALPVSEAAFEEEELFRENFVLIRPAADAGRPAPSSDGLRAMRLLLLEEGHCFRDQALSFCDMRAATPREVMDGSSLTTLVQMVGAGMGVTLIPEMAVPVETRLAKVCVTRFGAPEPSRIMGMIWRRTSPLAGQFHELAAVIRNGIEAAGIGRPGSLPA